MAEEIYQECLEFELELRGIAFQSKAELKCFYKGRELKRRYVPDLFVFGRPVVELKAVAELLPEHEAQLFNYMGIACQPVGYLVNFGHKGALEWKRFILSDLTEPSLAAHQY
jgi:GxxExxY protein